MVRTYEFHIHIPHGKNAQLYWVIFRSCSPVTILFSVLWNVFNLKVSEMQRRLKIMLVSILVVLIIITSFTVSELTTEPQVPNIPVISSQELYNSTVSFSLANLIPHDPLNNCAGPTMNPANVTSEINASYLGSNVSFLFYTDVFPWSFNTSMKNPFSGKSVILYHSWVESVVKLGQNLSFPVTGFTFYISNFTLSINSSALFSLKSFSYSSNACPYQSKNIITYTSPPAEMPFNFTVGNLSAVNRFYYVNYSFDFIPIVEIGFIHYSLKPIYVSNYYLAPWGFKTPQKPWWER